MFRLARVCCAAHTGCIPLVRGQRRPLGGVHVLAASEPVQFAPLRLAAEPEVDAEGPAEIGREEEAVG